MDSKFKFGKFLENDCDVDDDGDGDLDIDDDDGDFEEVDDDADGDVDDGNVSKPSPFSVNTISSPPPLPS